ncbi:MAG: glycosyltransferase family 2 protein [Candidatus Levyibacteriota bacterium]
MQSLSIIIPTWNEVGNIGHLIERINNTLYHKNISYEIIVVDDHSSDKTQSVVKHFAQRFPVRLYLKQGIPGKAQSLLEGFSYAQYDLLCMIDGDLQYQPESIPEMLDKINRGADVVVANRILSNTTFIRNFFSRSFLYIFGKILHGLNFDIQSGLKIFKKEIIERLHIYPSPWTFDLEFLKKSLDAGYKIDTINMRLAKRTSGETKIHLLKSSWEIGINAIKMKFQGKEIIPFHRNTRKVKGNGFHYNGKEFIHYSLLKPAETAFQRITFQQGVYIIVTLLILLTGLIINWHTTIIIFIAVLTFLYFIDLLFNLYLITRSFVKPAEIKVSIEEIQAIPDHIWPSYTVFCPLYKEWQVIPQFVNSMSKLIYPKDKLQVMLLLEANDKETIDQVAKFNLPSYFEVVIVPHSYPKTKPKACNYGLTKATGEYAVIYDAEDAPDPLQLKKSVIAFAKARRNTICVQAKLNFYNPQQNFLTRVFTAEYSLWFDLVLTGLQSIGAPIPLGGTSNHFRTKDLHKLKGWDSFNVTEDADLGIRLVKEGYTTAIVDSETLEEANSSLMNWFAQRSRWIKGYMQTYLVHTRNLKTFLPSNKRVHLITFQLVIGGKVLSLFINPLMWFITLTYFIFRPFVGDFIESFFPAPVLYMGVFSLVVGNFLYLYYYMIGCAKHGHYDLIQYVFLVPLYWLTMSIASWIALYQLIVKPHHWSKTKHGLHLKLKETSDQVKQVVKKELATKNMVGI